VGRNSKPTSILVMGDLGSAVESGAEPRENAVLVHFKASKTNSLISIFYSW